MTTDFRSFKEKGKKPKDDARPADGTDASRRWWTMKGSDCVASIRGTVEQLERNQSPRLRQLVINARLYGNVTLYGSAGAAYARLMANQSAAKERLTYPKTQSCIDTLVARVGETKPRPYFLTSGGNYRQQRRAKKLTEFIDGAFYETKAYDLGNDAFRDGAVFGDGFLHPFIRGKRIELERVQAGELWVDEVEAQYGYPRNMHRVKDVDRDELIGWVEATEEDKKKRDKLVEAIRRANKAPETGSVRGSNLSDMVRVVESWHLGTYDEAGDCVGGKHAIALTGSDKMLVEPEEWPHGFFPFARMPWCRRPWGYWSQGLAEQLAGCQLELNKELWFIQRSMHLAGTPKLLLPIGSKVDPEHYNNDIGAIIKWAGNIKPELYAPQPIHEVYFTNVERIAARMENIAGLSQLATSAAKPAGLNSGKALRAFEEIESDRHRTTQRNNNNLYLELASMLIALARENGFKVRMPGKNGFSEIDFTKDLGDLADADFIMQCFPTSRLPKDPSGQLQTIQEYIQAGFLTPRQGRRLLNMPDLEASDSLATAQEDLITKTLDDIVDDGKYRPPEPTDDLDAAKEDVLYYISRYRLLGLEDDKLELLRNYNSQLDMLKARQQAALAPTAIAGPVGVPQASPQAAPQSDLLPQRAA